MPTQFVNGRFQAFDDNGDPLVGGLLYTYTAGTTTNKTTYSDPGLTTPNTNPVVLDARGEADVWWGTGTIRMTLKTSADVTVWDKDNIPTASQSVGTSFIQSLFDDTTAAEARATLGAAALASYRAETASTYTPVLSDADSVLIGLNDASGVTLTIPPNSSVAYDIGDVLSFAQAGAGPVTIAAGVGVTVNKSSTVNAVSAAQNAVFQIVKTATDTWTLFGDLQQTRAGYLLGSFQAFTTSGAHTWTKPSGCAAVMVEVVGGGGGGRGPAAATAAAGGGAGGYSRKFITSGLGATESVTVGAGGGGGAAGGTNGSNGTSSSFGSHCSATGGGFGSNAGGAGGIGSGGDFNARGGPGGFRISTADNYSGNGGDSYFSGGGQAGASGSAAGTAGIYGSGGGGGRDNAAGGAGGAGVVIVWEYY